MKTLKALLIGIAIFAASNAAKAQVAVGVHIGTPPPPPTRVVVVDRPVHHRTVVVRRPVRRPVVVHRPAYRRVVVQRRHYVKQRYYARPVARHHHRY